MIIQAAVVAFGILSFLYVRERHRTLGRLRYSSGRRAKARDKALKTVLGEFDEFFGRVRYTGRVIVRREGDRLVVETKPKLASRDEQSFRNLLGLYRLKGRVIVSMSGRLQRSRL